MISNPIARITAAIILIISLLSIIGVFGVDIDTDAKTLLGTMIGISGTFLFVAQTKAASNTG